MKGYVIKLDYIILSHIKISEYLPKYKNDIGTHWLNKAKIYKTKQGALKKAKAYEKEKSYFDMKCSLMYIEDITEAKK